MAILIGFILIFFGANVSADNLNYGAHFLKSTVGVKSMSLAGAGVASNGSAGAININPSAIIMSSSFLHAEETRIFPDQEQSVFSSAFKINSYYLGLSALYKNDYNIKPADEFGKYDSNGSLGWQDFLLSFEVGKKFKNIDLGISIKGFRQSILQYSRLGVAFDFGLRKKFFNNRLVAGLSVSNLGKAKPFIDIQEKLPVVFKSGLSFNTKLSDIFFELLTDINYRTETKSAFFPIALEMKYKEILFLRAGYPINKDKEKGSLGMGIRYKKIQVDYAFMLVDNDFNPNHTIGITFWSF